MKRDFNFRIGYNGVLLRLGNQLLVALSLRLFSPFVHVLNGLSLVTFKYLSGFMSAFLYWFYALDFDFGDFRVVFLKWYETLRRLILFHWSWVLFLYYRGRLRGFQVSIFADIFLNIWLNLLYIPLWVQRFSVIDYWMTLTPSLYTRFVPLTDAANTVLHHTLAAAFRHALDTTNRLRAWLLPFFNSFPFASRLKFQVKFCLQAVNFSQVSCTEELFLFGLFDTQMQFLRENTSVLNTMYLPCCVSLRIWYTPQ